jgi:hypothetical protein
LEDAVEGLYYVKWLIVPNTIFNVTNTNNLIPTDLGNVYITPGNYTGGTLATEVQASLRSLGGAYAAIVVTYSSLTGKLTFSVPVNFIYAASGSDKLSAATIGMRSSVTTTVSQYPIYFGAPLSLGINFREASSYGYRTSTFRSGSVIIPFVAASNSFDLSFYRDNPQQVLFLHEAKHLHVTVVDPVTGDVVPLRSGDWQILLERVHSIPKPRLVGHKTQRAYFHHGP